jgi:hypothetical protein
VFDRTQGINDAPARRQKLVDMATAPSPNPNKTIVGPHNWVHEPLNPNLDLVADDLVYLAQHVLDQIPPTADITPPTSSAVLTPASNDNGWNNADAVVTLTATDNPGGSGVKEIEFSLSGAQSDTGTQDGDTADINILNEGMTMVTFFARDVAGNPETPANTLDINLDKTPPSIEAVASPPPNAFGWNNSDVTVSYTASDALSGVAELLPGGSVPVTTEGAAQEIIGTASDRADNHSAAAALVSLDKTAPELTGAPDRAPDSNGWYNQPLTVTWSCTDALSGVQSFITLSNYSGPDSAGASVSGDCFDLALNNTIAAMGFQFDATSPEIDVTTPPDGASYLLNAAVTSAYACTDNLSGVASCIGPVASGDAVDTATVNAKQFTVDAADVAGNHAGATHVYSVHYEFSGFRSPVGGTPAVNVAKAGRTIPIKYQLRDANGVSISDLGSFVSLQSAPIACGAGAPSGIVGENATASGGTVLRYDGTAGQFVYNWDTSRSWTGCRALQLTLNDGTKHLAVFQFK